MQFVFQPLVYGFLLVLVPLLVHLINLVRHRRQAWAAMDFLLESYKKHRRWVLLKQWLLLLSRMAAMAILVAMLAGWISSNRWLPSWLGQQVIHHYVLLDDSYSMSDGLQGETAYDKGLQAIDAIVKQAASDNAEHRLTLLRWSRSGTALQGNNTSANSVADFLATSIPKNNEKFLDKLKTTRPTGLELSPEAAIDLIKPVVEGFRGEQATVYVVSDFRTNQWERPEAIRTSLQPLTASGAEIQFVDCVRNEHENLSIEMLQPEQEVWAAGVPLFIEVRVKNHGQQSVRNLLVKPRTIEYADASVKPLSDLPYSGVITELPPVVIDQINAGESAVRRFQVVFESPGQHAIDASLPDDAVLTDNYRVCTLPLTDGQQVLLIDGDLTRTNAFFMEAALNPGSTARTGLRIDIQNESFLREQTAESLAAYSAIYLFDLPRLEEPAIAKLEQYADSGGGICFFIGDNVDRNHYNQRLFNTGKGLFPLELADAKVLAEAPADSDLADLVAQQHPIFGPLLSNAGSPFRLIRFQRFVDSVSSDKQATENTANESEQTAISSLQIVAKLRTGEPLIVDRPFGQGRVLTVLSSLLPTWNNWAQDPTFVVFALRSVGYLGSFRRPETGIPCGTAWKEEVALQKYLPEVEFLVPAGNSGTRLPLKLPVAAVAQSSPDDPPAIGMATLSVANGEMSEEVIHQLLSPGLIEGWKTDITGNREVHNRAFFATPSEGDLRKPTPTALIANMRPLSVKHRYAENVASNMLAAGLISRDSLLMFLLLALLIIEQALAYAASFHPPLRKGEAR